GDIINKAQREQKEKIMQILEVSEAEADEIMQCDKAIDRGERVYFDLSPEAEKQAKKLANVTTRKKPTVYNFNKRERKANVTKADIIAFLAEKLTEYGGENLEITNKERMIAFGFNGENYEVTLIQKRKSKK
ncbi:MAG: hypothetical protein ACI4PK_03465, partial [Oscillospiraceae bacterium]